ncbi:hypothetical protein ACOMHN_056422 [Nucella lapillus]
MKIVIEDPETLTQWTSVGVSKGLTSDADIARFLLTLYWDVKENPTAAQKAKCAVCHTSLDLYCTLCRASSPHALSTTPPQSSQPPSPLIIGMNPQQSDPARLPVLQAGNDSSAPVHSGGTDTGTSDTSGMLKSVSHSEDVLTQLPDCSDIAGTGRLQECEHTVQPGNYVGNGVDGQPEEEPNAGNAGGVDTEALYNHSKLRARDRKCPQCQVTLLSGCQVTKHRRQHEREKARFCTHCRRSFPAMTKKDFDRHLTKHQTKGKKKPAEAVLCPQCGKVFKKKEDLNNHMTYHNKDSPFPCPLCPKAFKNRACLRQHRLFHGEKTQQCEVCGDKFYRKAGLRRHMQKHTGKRHACQECTHRFYSPTELQVHVDSVHKGIRHFSCPRCELRFYKAASLKIHMRTHTGEKPFGCDQCPARFTVGEALRKHMRRHTGEKPFVCEDCGQRYACQYSYTTHRTKHHTHRRYTCGHCPQAFVMRSSLRFHRKMCHEGNDHNCKN